MKTLEQKAKDLQLQAEKILALIPYRDYFRHIQDYQNSYVVEMRRLFGNKLRAQGYTLADIGQTIGRSHCTVHYNKEIESAEYVNKVVESNYEGWIKQKVYPEVYHTLEPNHLSKSKYKSVTKYRLVPITKI